MAELNEIKDWLDKKLHKEEVKDCSWNGLQFEGKKEVNKIAFAVDACKDTFNAAIDAQSDMIITHHGMFWKHADPSIKGFNKERLELLYKNGISLYASHIPLDKHKEVGNNAQLIKLLGGKIIDEFLHEDDKNIGWIARFKHKIPLHELQFILEKNLNTKCKVLNFGDQKVEKLAVCSGGGGHKEFHEARKVADAFLTGESPDVYQIAKDTNFNVIFAGHYATETVGVKALMPLLQKKFKIETVFIDKPTGL